MIKTLHLLLLFSLYSLAATTTSFAFAKANYPYPPKTTASSISKVTVFLRGAQIERKATLKVQPGTNSIVLDNLSSDIDENSIQVSGLGSSSILSINFGINYLTEHLNLNKIDSLQTAMQSLQTQVLKLENVQSGLRKEEEVLSTNQKLGSDKTATDLTNIKTLSNYYRNRITEIRNELLDIELKKQLLQRNVANIKKQFQEFNVTEEKSKGQITLKLSSKTAQTLDLHIKYQVNEAGWYPEYDLRTKSTDLPLELSYKAYVYQQTGIQWEDVNLVLSTGDPNTNNLKPVLDTKYLKFVNHYYKNVHKPTKAYNYKYNPNITSISGIVTENGQPLPGANVMVVGTSNGTQTDFDGKYSLRVERGEQLAFSFVGFATKQIPIHASVINTNLEIDSSLEEVIVTAQGIKREKKALGYAVSTIKSESLSNQLIRGTSSINKETATGDIKTEGITNTTFEIKEKYTIESDGDVTVMEIDHFTVPATYEYYLAPIINENVFLTATIKDWVRYSLLPGDANIYFNGSFSGKTFINPLETTEELSVSLGVDPNIIVKRKQLDNFKSTSFIGSQRMVHMAYSITLKNNKSKAITLLMEDRIPISQNKEIKIDEIVTGDGIYSKETGIIKWNLTVAPSNSIIKNISYEVKYNKDKKINL
ncbi:DUF4139 domain-containing protein [Dokdonia sp. Hel_I_53]|uniref:DUF4139 domain-containing protein n=1 Tax=Dokdonia sp. Hel_I_53 TaxID=1566287 RepID=UPI00119A7060|nr:DUF4139 domain-containing protein [Dokdonia sp. Hel_I_53]TVZ51711.1 uncharacterized protein (TIGR02231 family) [Dokdonia sp. Hel_I_53]